jgi:transposase
MAGVTWWNFYFRLFPGTIRSPQVIGFLRHLLCHIPGKLLIVWDGLTGHRGRLTWEFIRQQRGRLWVEFLPGYAPDLNPVEYLWSHWKQHELPNFCPQNFGQLSHYARKALCRMRKRPSLVIAFWRQDKVASAAVERLYTGTRWAEGPVWFGDGRCLLFSDIPNNRMLRWQEETGEVSIFRSPSNYSNGNYRDRQGRLITCEHDTRRLTRTEYDGTITVLMDHFQGKMLNAPNDLAVHSDGAIWFTDPGYGIMPNYEGQKAPFELPDNVYRLDPKTCEVTVVVSDLDKPNGICFCPDEKKLYLVCISA